MLSVEDRQSIVDLAQKYALKRVLLFGSAARDSEVCRDIDLGVEGIRPGDFFRLYGELLSRLSLPVDLVDLSKSGRFTQLIRREGVPLYG